MTIKLIIAGIKWSCEVPDAIFNESILSFSSDFIGDEDINLEIRFTDCFDVPIGKSITNEVLEWYVRKDSNISYQLIKRDEYNSDILVSLKTNEAWSDVLIEAKYSSLTVIEIINILFVEIVFRNRLHFHDGFVMHSSAIEFEGEAIAFAAPSGTGKSTHTGLWQEYYKAKIINDDHPAVRIINGKPIIFGTPWAGETKKYNNTSSILKGVVVLEQGDINKIWTLNNNEILKEFMPRCFLPYYNSEILVRTLRIFNDLVNYIKIYKLICKPDKEAVMLVKKYVWTNKQNSGMVICE